MWPLDISSKLAPLRVGMVLMARRVEKLLVRSPWANKGADNSREVLGWLTLLGVRPHISASGQFIQRRGSTGMGISGGVIVEHKSSASGEATTATRSFGEMTSRANRCAMRLACSL